MSLQRTALFDAHAALQARLVPFAGYEMPVQYTGIIAEARAVREHAGMFDVSHMARLRFRGNGSLPFLEQVTSNDVSKLKTDGGQYSLLPNTEGGCVDDIIVYRLEDHFYMVVNASNHAKDLDWLEGFRPSDVQIEDETDATAMIAVQGPEALEILAKLSNEGEAFGEAPSFGVIYVSVGDVRCQAARSGYTGEDGYELICPASEADRLWQALLNAGVVPCGLGARDTLRVEAGLPLYGHELADDLNPISAGLGWVVSKTKDFNGSTPIKNAQATGTPTRLVGVKLEAKRLTSQGMSVLVDGETVGVVSSGVVSPTFDTALALAFIDSAVPYGTTCTVETRGKAEAGLIVSKRFYKRSS